MTKITLNPIQDLTQTTTAQTTINGNNNVIQSAMDNTLSRDGTLPNQMNANIDMNNNHILNLPQPATGQEPLRFQDLQSFIGGGTITNIPPGGASGSVLTKTAAADYQVGWANDNTLITAGTNLTASGTNPVTISTVSSPTFTGTLTTNALVTNSQISAPTFVAGYTTTVTAAGTTTLTTGSTYNQYFTGSTTQTLVLPVASTMVLGQSYRITNLSTGAVTVQSSGLNTVVIVPGNGCVAIVTCILTSGTTAASWNSISDFELVASGKVLNVSNSLTLAGVDGKSLNLNNSLTLAGTDGTTMTFPTTSATIARTDASNTFTGNQVIPTVNGNTITTGTGTLTLGANTLTVNNGGTLTGSSSAAVFYDNIPQNSQSAAYTLVLSDASKHILHPSSDNVARTFTIPANASVAYPVGTAITFVNQINTVTIAITSDTLTLAGTGGTGSRTLGANGIATALKIGATSWIISGTSIT